MQAARVTSVRSLALRIALIGLLLLPVVATLRFRLGNTTTFPYALQTFTQAPLPNFAPRTTRNSQGEANTRLVASTTGWWATAGALLVFASEWSQLLTGRGMLWIIVAVFLATLLWRAISLRRGWRTPSIPLAILLALQLCGAAYYFSTFRAPSRLLSTPYTAFDFHTHTTRSSGLLTPQQQIDWHRERGFKGLAFTDTNQMMAAGEFAALQAANRDMLLLNGCEYQSGKAHLILLGVKKPIDGRIVRDVSQAVKLAKSQGAMVIVAHPWWPERHALDEFIAMGVDGFEAWNGVIWDRSVAQLTKSKRLITTGATDDLSKSGARCFTWTLLPRGMDDTGDILRALKMRKTSVAYALGDSNTPQSFDQNRKALRNPLSLFRAAADAGRTLTRAQQISSVLGMVIVASLLCAWGAAPARKAITLSGPQRAVGFLRRRRLTVRAIAALLMALAFIASMAAAWLAMSEHGSVSFMEFTPLHAVFSWILLDVLFLYAQALWHRAV